MGDKQTATDRCVPLPPDSPGALLRREQEHLNSSRQDVPVYSEQEHLGEQEHLNSSKREREIKIVKLLLIVFGVSSLLPGFIAINAASFYMARFVGTKFESTFAYYFQSVSIIALLAGSFSSIYISKKINVRILAVASNVVMGAPMGIMMVLAAVNTDGWEEAFFILNLICFFISAFGCGMQTSTVSALASMINPELLKPYYAGKGVAGIVAVVISLITVSFPGMNPDKAATYYFLFTTLLVAGLVTYMLYRFINLEYVKECTIKKNNDTKETVAGESGAMSTLELLKCAKLPIIAVTLQVFVSFVLFPAMLTNLKPISADPNGTWATKYFLLVCVYLVWTIGDMMGKVTSMFLLWPGMNLLVILSAVRVLLIPMVMMCNITPRTLPVWFNSDVCPVIFIFLTAFSTGHMLNLSIAAAPKYVEGTVDKGNVSQLLFLFVASAMVISSCSTFGFAAIIDI